jgi:hypothetical protein
LRLAVIVAGVAIFLAASALVARWLTTDNAERTKVERLLRAQARGDAGAVLADLPACRREPACARVTRERVARLRREGRIEILNYRPSAQLSLTRRTGSGRVAWRAGRGLPIVQCVRVRRDGPLSGAGVELLSISAPIGNEASCPN